MNIELLCLVFIIALVFYFNYSRELKRENKIKEVKELMILAQKISRANREAQESLPEINQLVFTPTYSSFEQYGSRPANQRVIKSNYLAKQDRSPEYQVYNSMSYKQFQN